MILRVKIEIFSRSKSISTEYKNISSYLTLNKVCITQSISNCAFVYKKARLQISTDLPLLGPGVFSPK